MAGRWLGKLTGGFIALFPLLTASISHADQAPRAMATVINRQGDALTVRHFTQECQEFVAVSADNHIHQSRVTWNKSTSDLSLIRIKNVRFHTERLFNANKPTFWVLSSNGQLPVVLSQRSGKVTAKPVEVESDRYLYFDGQVELGDSGAAVRHPDGYLMGMVVADIVSPPYGGLLLKPSILNQALSKAGVKPDGTFIPVVLKCVA